MELLSGMCVCVWGGGLCVTQQNVSNCCHVRAKHYAEIWHAVLTKRQPCYSVIIRETFLFLMFNLLSECEHQLCYLLSRSWRPARGSHRLERVLISDDDDSEMTPSAFLFMLTMSLSVRNLVLN